MPTARSRARSPKRTLKNCLGESRRNPVCEPARHLTPRSDPKADPTRPGGASLERNRPRWVRPAPSCSLNAAIKSRISEDCACTTLMMGDAVRLNSPFILARRRIDSPRQACHDASCFHLSPARKHRQKSLLEKRLLAYAAMQKYHLSQVPGLTCRLRPAR